MNENGETRRRVVHHYSGDMSCSTQLSPEIEAARSLIRTIPDYPKSGVQFRDITPLMADAQALRDCVEALIEPFSGQFDLVAGVEARGFLLAGSAAVVAGVGLAPLRKAGKLPRPAASVNYDLEYGTATIEASEDITPGMRVLLLDDVLATGGTLAAGRALIEKMGAKVAGTAVLMELDGLGGRQLVPDVHALFSM